MLFECTTFLPRKDHTFSSTDVERFYLKARWTHFTEKGCVLWKTGKSVKGYGIFWLNGQSVRAHRASYLLFIGEIPPSLDVLHICDTPLCVNPFHLVTGTNQDNVDDKIVKDRQLKGETVGTSLLTEDKVRFLRKMRVNGFTLEHLGRILNVHPSTVHLAAVGKSWKHVR